MGVCSSVDEKAGDTTAGLSPSEIDVKRAMSIVGSAPSGKTMCKLRSRSDASLEDLLTQPVVKKAFQTFLTPLDADRLLMFWTACHDYNQLKDEHPDKLKTARDILHTYFGNEKEKQQLALDSATLDSLKAAVERQTKGPIFDLAAEKIFQRLKFDYMPRFLLSKEFTSLKASNNTPLSDSVGSGPLATVGAGPSRTKTASATTLSLRFVLNRAAGQELFLQFLHQSRTKDHYEVAHVLELWNEIEDFRHSEDPQYRSKRMKIIMARYLDEDAPVAVTLPEAALKKFDEALEKLQEDAPPVDIFADIKDTALQIMEEPFREFKSCELYDDFRQSLDDESGLQNTIFALQAFKEDRSLSETKDEQMSLDIKDFKSLWENKTAMSFFRRFLRLEFSEESLMFYYEVKEFESGNYLAPEYGTMIFAAATADDSERQFLRAEKLCKKYVADDARFQINVPSGIRDKILEKYKGGKAMITKDMFRDATDNLYKMLEHDKFDRFKRHALYTHYKRCASTKFMKRKFKVH